jgi:hypothetical protein
VSSNEEECGEFVFSFSSVKLERILLAMGLLGPLHKIQGYLCKQKLRSKAAVYML